MYNIEFKSKALFYLEYYFRKYREYYQKLYEDSGLWNENQIIEGYNIEAKTRMQEIVDLVEDRISNEKVLYRTLENTVFLKWRTKFIFVKWEENKKLKTRYILELEIR